MEFRFETQRLTARRKLLNRAEVMTFDGVPGFIVNSFFDGYSCRNQLLVSTFGFLNGISVDSLFSIIRWKDLTAERKKRIRDLYERYLDPAYQARYYSFNVHHKSVTTLLFLLSFITPLVTPLVKVI